MKMFVFFLIISFLILNTRSQSDFLESNFQEIVYPTVISREEIRRRRSLRDIDKDSIFISISNWTIRTKLNSALIIPPYFDIDWIQSDRTRTEKSTFPLNCQAVHGSVENEKNIDNSLIVMTICQKEFYGLLLIDNRYYFLQPIANGRHVLYEDGDINWKSVKENNSLALFRKNEEIRRMKRQEKKENLDKFYNLTGDTFEIENAKVLIDAESERNLEDEPNYQEVAYFYDKTWKWSKLPKRKIVYDNVYPRWLEIGIAADNSVVEFHGTRMQHYILALVNIVSAIYSDPSLDSNMKLVIAKVMLYTSRNDNMISSGNARKSLENVNKWHRKLLASSEEPHDVAVWLTRLDIGGPSGYAPVSGVCDPSRSCALNRDEGLSSAFIIAHEIAHILGLSHDGDVDSGNTCGEEAVYGSVMAPMVAATFRRFHWSACSRKEFHQKAQQWSCLLNQPSEEGAIQIKETTLLTFTMDEQCRMEFGEGYQLCRSIDLVEPCSYLWCGKPNVSKICKTKKGPPLDGTECGENKWCISGFCESIDMKLNLTPVESNGRNEITGDWSEWEKCSTTCGVGVQIRTRKCSKFDKDDDENSCEEKSQEFRICQQDDCATLLDLRAQQCSQLSSLIDIEKTLSIPYNTWLPYESEKEELRCKLICRSKETGNLYFSNKNLKDGTPCSYESSDICVKGKCYSMGCDRVLNSEKIKDSCGVCGGDNSTCENVVKKFHRKLRRPSARLGVIPPSAHNIRIDVTISGLSSTENNSMIILIKDGRKQKSEIKHFDSQGKGKIVIVEGAAFRPQKINETYTMWSRGPVLKEIIVSLSLVDVDLKKGIFISAFSRYVINRNQWKENKYSWLLGGWSSCSVTCGGGYRHKTLTCKDMETGKLVNKRKCPLISKPSLNIEKCNSFSCEFKWLEGFWEGCTKTCGNAGYQQRQLFCVHSSFADSHMTIDNERLIYKTMVSPDKCKMQKEPVTERECSRVPCAGQWIYAEWSPCSQTCGIGIQSQIAQCIPLEGEAFASCNGTYLPDKMRLCRGSSKRNPKCANYCQKDRSQYCTLKNLKRYCQIPVFRRKCCHSCQKN